MAGVVDTTDPNHPREVYYGGTAFNNLSDMMADLWVDYYPEDKIATFPDPALNLGSKITIDRALPVEVTDAKVTKIYRTWEKTVEGLLKEKKLELMGQDSVEPSLSTWLRQNIKITITRVAEVEVTEKEAINYQVLKKTSVDLEKGESEIERKGAKGEKEVIYIIKRVDGVETSKTQKSSTVTKEPVNEIVIIGIGPKYAKSGPYKDAINAAARRYLINGTALMCLMLAESGGDPYSGYPDGQYQGLFQYDPGFWNDIGGGSITDPEAQINTTAWALTHGYAGRWPPWSRCSNK